MEMNVNKQLGQVIYTCSRFPYEAEIIQIF